MEEFPPHLHAETFLLVQRHLDLDARLKLETASSVWRQWLQWADVRNKKVKGKLSSQR